MRVLSQSQLLGLLLIICMSAMFAQADPAKYNQRTGAKFLEENKDKEGVVVLPSGLQYKVLKAGDGKSHPGPSTQCTVHYEGRLINEKVFDSSYRRGQPANFAPNGVIKGWTEALQLMTKGDKWELYIPYDLAYGARGVGRDIGPYSTLIFTVELIDFENAGKGDL